MSNPFRGFFDSVSENNRAMENWMTTAPHPGEVQRERGYADAWTPEVDVLSEGSDLVMLVEVPGVAEDDVEISLSGGTLTISGEKHGRGTDGEYYARERRFGYFRRSMTLPQSVRADRIDTSLENGVLEVTIRDYATLSEPERVELGRSGS
jgi:HSP20 family protein